MGRGNGQSVSWDSETRESVKGAMRPLRADSYSKAANILVEAGLEVLAGSETNPEYAAMLKKAEERVWERVTRVMKEREKKRRATNEKKKTEATRPAAVAKPAPIAGRRVAQKGSEPAAISKKRIH